MDELLPVDSFCPADNGYDGHGCEDKHDPRKAQALHRILTEVIGVLGRSAD